MKRKKLISNTIGMAAAASMLFTNTYVQATELPTPTPVAETEGKAELTPTPEAGEKTPELTATLTPTPGAGEETPEPTATPMPTPGAGEETPELTATPTPTPGTGTESPEPTETPTPTPTPEPVAKGAPKLLTLTAVDEESSLDKMSPAFSPDVYIYHFLDNGQVGKVRTMNATVDPDVTVTVNGEEVPVNEEGSCTIAIPYKSSGSENDVVLTRKETGEKSVYQFHTYFTGITNYSGNYSLVTSQKENDDENISKLTAQGNGQVYDATTNLSKVRLRMDVSPAENQVFQAELTDKNGEKQDSFLFAGGEEGESTTLDSRVLYLEEGENVFYLNCHGTYTRWENGSPIQEEGVLTVTFRIYRNPVDDPQVNKNTALKGMKVSLNGLDGTDYIQDFSPDKKEYKVRLSADQFDQALTSNRIWLTLETGDDRQKIRVIGKSTLHGISPDDVKKESNGGYILADYNAADLYGAESFTTRILVTAPDNITTDTYEITVERSGKSGMLVPDVYRNTSFVIVPSQPERKVILTLASVDIYNNGNKATGSQAIADGRLKIRIEDTGVISEEEKQFSSEYTVRLNGPGTTPVWLIYDDGVNHYEDSISVAVYYNISGLLSEINTAEDLLNTTQKSDRIYEDGAADTFSQAIRSARQVYNRYVNAKLTAEESQIVTDAVVALQKAEDVYRRSEIGKKITAFVALADDIAIQNVPNGSSILKVKRPKTLDVIIDGKVETISGVKWTSRPEWQTTVYEEIKYRFTPQLPAGYVVMEGVDYPVITVNRTAKKLPVEVKRTIPLDASVLVQHVPYGTRKSELNFPDHLEMYRDESSGADGGTIEVPVKWKDMDGFDGQTVGAYTFKSVINASADDFKLAQNTTQDPMQIITVIVDPPKKDENTGGDKANGDGNGDGNGTGNGTGTGDGSGIGNGTGDGNGTGSGTGNGDRQGDQKGSTRSGQKGNGTKNGSGGKNKNSSGSGVGQQNQKAPSDAGESSGKDENSRETFAENSGGGSEGGNSGRELKGDDIKKSTASEENNSAGNEKKKSWKVAEIVGDTVESHRGEFIFLGLMIMLLLFYGGFREYRRHRDDDSDKKK